MTVRTHCQQVSDISQLKQPFMIYYQTDNSADRCITRVINRNTNVDNLKHEIKKGHIFIPNETIIAQDI
ncbi:MAG: hypothetical protein JXR07_20365 [Reichenbachiella sp.]